jgi:hypothetical protein
MLSEFLDGWKKCVSQCKVCFPANEITAFVNSKIEKINYTVQMQFDSCQVVDFIGQSNKPT